MGRNTKRRKAVKEQRRGLKGFRMPALDVKMVRFPLPTPVWKDLCTAVREMNEAFKDTPEHIELMPTQQLYRLVVTYLAQWQGIKRREAEEKRLVQPVDGSLLTQLEKFEKEHPGETPRIRLPGEEDARGQKSQAPKHPGSSLIT